MSLSSEMLNSFSDKINMPPLLLDLCEWIDLNGYGGIETYFKLLPDKEKVLYQYFDNGNSIADYFDVFAHTWSGGLIAFWNKNKDEKPIVHFGSEGDDWHILAPNFTSYLISISTAGNSEFRKWLERELNRSISLKDKIIIDRKDRSLTKWLYEKLEIKIPFEQFDPDSEYNSTSNSIDYKVLLNDIPNNKPEFMKTARILSKLSISDLLKGMQNLPCTIYEGHTFFRGAIDLNNFPEPDRSFLIELVSKYPNHVQIKYRKYLGENGKTDFKTLVI